MPDSATSSGIQAACAALKAALADTPHVGMQVWKEEQLKGPVAAFTRAVAMALGVITTSVFPETPVEGVGRPDLGVTVEQLLCGYIELKAPGKGADPTKFKDRADKDQWSRFRNLPNLIYTDGHALALYRSGQRVGAVVDVDGLQAASTLELVFRDFFAWQPTIPTSAAALARMLAPLCRLLRDEVRQALEQPGKTAMKLLREQWERTLLVTRTADDFADEYAQTLTYALVLARAEGAVSLEIETAAKTLEGKNEFLSQVLRVLAQPKAKSALNTPTSLLQRSIERVDPAAMASKAPSFHGGDPWLYFYEDFLEEYDPERRRTYGVYYTPVPVVQAQVRLVAELLQQHFNRPRSYFDDVMLLDPAVGTGSYPLAALRHAADAVEIQYGRAAAAEAVAAALPNVYAFERFVGPYAIAHLRLTQMALDLGATAAQLPVAGVNVLLADTLSDPEAAETGQIELFAQRLSEESHRANAVKRDLPVMVCLGNPPYLRRKNEDGEFGGWVRRGRPDKGQRGLLEDFIDPLKDSGAGSSANTLHELSVYFWRWAIWKVLEQRPEPGIISFITPSAYLAGPGHAGMRQVMRQRFDDIWILDLGGDNRGASSAAAANVFAIETGVCIAVCVRYADPQETTPARVRYHEVQGSRQDKLAALGSIMSFDDIDWETCAEALQAPFLPVVDQQYGGWPTVMQLVPWQVSGAQFKRTWPIAETADLLRQ